MPGTGLFLSFCFQSVIDDPDVVHDVRSFIRKHLASELKAEFLRTDTQITELALNEYRTATNMTDQFAALAALVQNTGKTRDDGLTDFYGKWKHYYLVVNRWFALQAMSDIPRNVENQHHWFLLLLVYNIFSNGCLQAQLEMIMSTNGLSENVFEIASKSLAT
ncbi:hypothetical protein MKW92_037474 [Papaver armeniacum]|nr:hypothetical protein MKW92_037474 [Papaver armeniacum]